MNETNRPETRPPPRLGMDTRIAGVGRYLPRRVVTNGELEARMGLAEGWILQHTGIEERRWSENEPAPYMAAQAIREALEQAQLSLEDVDLIINASATRTQAMPDGAHLIQRELGLGGSGVPCLSVHATCMSFLVALDVAAAHISVGRYRRVLIVSAEISSRGLNWEDRSSAPLFGDGAAAAVIVPSEPGEGSGIQQMRLESYGESAELAQIRGGGTALPAAGPDADPQHFQFEMDGMGLAVLVAKRMKPFLERLRPGLSQGLGDIDWVVPHQPGQHAVRAMQRGVGFSRESIVLTYPRLGNCVAASIPLTLYEGIQSGQIRRGQRVLLLGIGAGVCFGGAILTY